MKSTIHLLAFAALFILSGCGNEPEPVPPPEPAPVQPAPEGTTINVGEDGVEIQSEGGDVTVSPDSAHIEIKPK